MSFARLINWRNSYRPSNGRKLRIIAEATSSGSVLKPSLIDPSQ
jgi:hypothetical protein